MDIETWLKYGGMPGIKSKKEGQKAYALMVRALYIQKNKERIKDFRNISNDIDYDEAEKQASLFGISLNEFLREYFSWIGYNEEYRIITENDAKKVIEMMEKKI